MSRIVLAVLLVAAAASAQWTEPVTLATGLQHYAAGPWLASHCGDSVWVFWIAQTTPPELRGRCFDGDTWRDTEVLFQGQAGVYSPTAIADDFGRVLASWYAGSYPTGASAGQDSWGIYTSVRTDSGWARPVLAIGTMAQCFPTNIRLGRARNGSLGMMWEESSGGMNAVESVMVSRRSAHGWTPRLCIAPGQYPNRACFSGLLVPGDTTSFLAAFSRWTYPDSSVVEVWNMEDSIVHQHAVFQGALPMIACGDDAWILVFCDGDSVMGSVNRGHGWSTPALVADNSGWGGPWLCADSEGWGWACWPDSQHQSVMVSYNRGSGWSVPETVATSSALGSPRIASDGAGSLHCAWFDHSGGGGGELRCSRRLARPGIADKAEGGRTKADYRAPTVMRAPGLARVDGRVFDMTGREVTDRRQRLAPGVYFVRAGRTAAGKVVVTR
jgi:hypothetical protein